MTEAVAALPEPPRLGGAIRAALSDFYFNSLRLVGANLVWSAVLFGLYVVGLAWPFGALILSPVLALPVAGIFRLGAQITRGEMTSFDDALDAWRRFGRDALVLGAAVVATGLILVVNVVAGIEEGGYLGLALATLAFWGLAIGSTGLLVAWPLLVDPRRPGIGLGEVVRLAGLLVLAFPIRFGALALVVGLFLVASMIAFAALAMLSVSLAALVSARYVLPASDRFEAQMTARARIRT
jgi:uncharacterized membrane protein YesL